MPLTQDKSPHRHYRSIAEEDRALYQTYRSARGTADSLNHALRVHGNGLTAAMHQSRDQRPAR